jgi:restriction system protein
LSLDDRELEYLVAAVLRAMGYKTKVSLPGPDRGVDVLASKDGLGFEEPRIKAEVKHRPNSQMGSSQIRNFIAGLRQGDKGLYVSTGGFSKEAKYEAERGSIPVVLIDLDEMGNLIVTHYDNFDLDGRTLIQLIKIYWPAD